MKGSFEAAKTHCPQGHPYDAANTRVAAGSRLCRKCASDYHKRRRRIGGRCVIAPAERTHCPKMHEYDLANTRNTLQGKRFCRACDRIAHRERHETRPEIQLLQSAKARARRLSLPFDITLDDIAVPATCPILGIPLKRGDGKFRDHSPSLDRIVPTLGYVRTNIAVISFRANRIKDNATADELRKIATWIESRRPLA